MEYIDKSNLSAIWIIGTIVLLFILLISIKIIDNICYICRNINSLLIVKSILIVAYLFIFIISIKAITINVINNHNTMSLLLVVLWTAFMSASAIILFKIINDNNE